MRTRWVLRFQTDTERYHDGRLAYRVLRLQLVVPR